MGKSVLMCVQHATRLIPLVVLGAGGAVAGVPEFSEGDNHASVADTATGVYTVTFTNAFARAPVIVATPIAATGVELFCIIRAVTASGFVIECTDEAGTLTDADIHILVLGFDSADEG